LLSSNQHHLHAPTPVWPGESILLTNGLSAPLPSVRNIFLGIPFWFVHFRAYGPDKQRINAFLKKFHVFKIGILCFILPRRAPEKSFF
jgi:hypothetical protein